MVGKITEYGLVDLKLYKEEDRYYLSATYEYEDEGGIYVTVVPKIELNINRYFNYTRGSSHLSDIYNEMYIDLIGNEHSKMVAVDNSYWNTTKIRDKTQKMTLAEIEKKLGHKIELVSGK